MEARYDYLVIGGGVVGCAIARKLSSYEGRIALLERECDVAMGTSGRNSGVSHAGFYVPEGTLKAKLNVLGHDMLKGVCSELSVPYKPIGKMVVAKDESESEYLQKLLKTGKANCCKSLSIIERDEIKRLEPNIEGHKALHSPTSAIVDPFLLTIALAENAKKNGADVFLETEVLGIEKKREGEFKVETNRMEFTAGCVINSAGLYSDKVAAMAGIDRYEIYPCRGEYHILDKSKRDLVNGLVYPVPPKDLGGLGIHITPTTDENIMLGPSAEYIEDRGDYACTKEVMDRLYCEAAEMLPKLSRKDIIRSFSGIRPKLIAKGAKAATDFVIEEDKNVEGLINLIGIESPGLTAAPAIADMVADIIAKKRTLKEKKGFDPALPKRIAFAELPEKEKAHLISQNPLYGEIVCRCQTITKKEVVDAVKNPLGAKGVSAVARRCRASLGRCQGGFCVPKIVEIIEEETGAKPEEITLKGAGSELFTATRWEK